MSWFNKRKVTVDTKKECDKGKSWTLIDNDNCVVKRFFDSSGVVRYLYDNDFNAKEWIDEKVQHEVAKELVRRNSEKFNKHFTFFINKDDAPLILNQMDVMECVGQWEIEQSEMFPAMVRVKYCASKQVLLQTSNGVAIHGD